MLARINMAADNGVTFSVCDDRIMFSLPCDETSDNTSEDMIGQTIYVPPYVVFDETERHLSPGPGPQVSDEEEDITPGSQTRMNQQRKETIPKQSLKAAEWAIRKLQQFLKKRNKVINFKEVSETRLANLLQLFYSTVSKTKLSSPYIVISGNDLYATPHKEV